MEFEYDTHNKNFCIAPWVHIHAWANGDVLPCCVSRHSDELKLGNLQDTSLADIYNSENTKALRLNMLDNKPSAHCARCYNDERFGFNSLRNKLNHDYLENNRDLVEMTTAEGIVPAEEMRIVYWDMRFSNLCNMKCRSCNTVSSSKWYDDELKLSKITGFSPPVDKFKKIRNDFSTLLEEIKPQVSNVEEIYFAGGEPLIMDEQWELLDEFIAQDKFDVRLKYQTNMSVLKYKDRDIISIWKQFPNLNIAMSLDASHGLGEYMRPGATWDTIESNIRKIKQEVPHAILQISPTVSAYNVTEIVKFYKYVVDNEFIEKWYFSLNLLEMPAYYHISILPASILQATKQDILELMSTFTTPDMSNVKSQFQSLVNAIDGPSNYNTGDWYKFCKVTTALDTMRNESVLEHLPWLQSYMKDYNDKNTQ